MRTTLRLKELSMTLDKDSDLTVLQAQQEFLSVQSECLEVLNLTINANDDYRTQHQHQVRFSVMNNLKKLSLQVEPLLEFSSPSYEVLTNPLSSIDPEHVPNLRTLAIHPELIAEFADPVSVFPSIQEVNLWIGNPDNIDIIFPGLTAWFPNLKKLTGLEIGLNEDELSNGMDLIAENLRNIADLELQMLPSEVPVDGFNLTISGVPVKSGWALSQLAEHVGYELLPSFFNPPGPSLRDLKRKYLSEQSKVNSKLTSIVL